MRTIAEIEAELSLLRKILEEDYFIGEEWTWSDCETAIITLEWILKTREEAPSANFEQPE